MRSSQKLHVLSFTYNRLTQISIEELINSDELSAIEERLQQFYGRKVNLYKDKNGIRHKTEYVFVRIEIISLYQKQDEYSNIEGVLQAEDGTEVRKPLRQILTYIESKIKD